MQYARRRLLWWRVRGVCRAAVLSLCDVCMCATATAAPLGDRRRSGDDMVSPGSYATRDEQANSEEFPGAEAARKRTSLELFLQRAVLPSPPSVLFLFTLSGHALPPPAAYFESIALPRNKRAEIFPSRANVLVQTVPPSTTDLCHRALAIRTARSRSLRTAH